MTRRVPIAAIAVALTIAAAASAADKPKVLADAAPGLWELSGVPGAKAPVRECLAKIGALATYEHRTRNCAATPLSDDGKVAVINYNCGDGDFGRTSIKVVTPRNLKVDTQGISDGLPFAYTIQARRVGECKAAGGSERGH